MRIGITGTQSTGKTTLVNLLSKLDEFKNYECVTERSKYLRDLGIPLNTDSTLKGQTLFLAERCSELLRENVITDRTVIDVIAFTLNAKSIPEEEKQQFKNYALNFISEYDYIFYISPEDIDIEDNGIRETNPIYRKIIDKTICNLLGESSIKDDNIYSIHGSNNQRINQILNFLNL